MTRRRVREAAKREKDKARWSSRLREQERAYRQRLKNQAGDAMRIGGPEAVRKLQEPNIHESPSDRFAFEDSMATSDEDEISENGRATLVRCGPLSSL
jgi:hypothetical protein